MDVSITMDTILTSIAVLTSALTLYIQRRHNKISVMPLLTVSYVKTDKEFKLILKNSGLGTAIIKKIQYENELNDKYDNLIDMLNKENRISWRCDTLYSEIANFNSDIILKMGDEIGILYYADAETAGVEEVSQAFEDKDIKMKIKYESLYKEEKELYCSLNCR